VSVPANAVTTITSGCLCAQTVEVGLLDELGLLVQPTRNLSSVKRMLLAHVDVRVGFVGNLFLYYFLDNVFNCDDACKRNKSGVL
jgi:hypothetical protein